MINKTREKIEALVLDDAKQKYIIAGVGLATFIFGFFAGAVLNYYLILVHSPLVAQFRASLTYQSSIFGDGVILPISFMFATYFILENKEFLRRRVLRNALISGILITIYFHLNQAMRGLVNWAMPEPWKWNELGAFHAGYMLLATTFISLFYLVLIKYVRRNKTIPREAFIVTLGIIIFLILLRLDYMTVDFSLPQLTPKP